MAVFDFDDEMEQLRVREAIAAIGNRGEPLAVSGLVEARRDFLRLLRELGATQLLLMKRGRLKGALLSSDGWLGLHSRFEGLLDLLAIHRWSSTDLPPIPLEAFMSTPMRLAHHADRPRRPPDEDWELLAPDYHVQVAPDVAHYLASEDPLVRTALIVRANILRRNPKPSIGESLGEPPQAWRLVRNARRIVWRIDGEVVTIVRIAEC